MTRPVDALRSCAEKSKLRWFRFPELLQPSRGIFRALASAPRQGHQNWSVYVSRLTGRNHSVHALPQMSPSNGQGSSLAEIEMNSRHRGGSWVHYGSCSRSILG